MFKSKIQLILLLETKPNTQRLYFHIFFSRRTRIRKLALDEFNIKFTGNWTESSLLLLLKILKITKCLSLDLSYQINIDSEKCKEGQHTLLNS